MLFVTASNGHDTCFIAYEVPTTLNILIVLGMDKTIQRGDLGKHGILFKVVPMHSEMKPSDNDFISCWYKALPKWLPRAGQSVIPTNLSEFKVKEKLENESEDILVRISNNK